MNAAEQVLEQVQQLRLRPVDVLDEDDRRLLGDDLGQELPPLVLEAVARSEGMQISGDVETEGEAENLPGPQSVEGELWWVALEKAQVLLQHLAQGPIRGSGSIRETAAGAAQRLGRLLGQHLPELTHDSRLADPCIADHRHEPRPALLDCRPVGTAEALEFLIAADERTREAPYAARSHEREGAHDATRHNSLWFSLRIDGRRPLELKGAARCGYGSLPNKNRPGSGSLLQTRGDVDRVAANEGTSCTSLPDDHVARVDADPQFEPPREQLRQSALHRERCV